MTDTIKLMEVRECFQRVKNGMYQVQSQLKGLDENNPQLAMAAVKTCTVVAREMQNMAEAQMQLVDIVKEGGKSAGLFDSIF